MLLVTALKSLLVRGLFAVHATICIWRVVAASGFEKFWVFAVVHYLVLIVEGLITFVATKKGEWTVFSPCVLIYLLTVIPCIWILEFDLFVERLEFADENNVECETITDISYNITNIDLEIIPIQIHIDYAQWSLVLQQMFVFVLIIGRWLLPKGQMTRDQLSQLLLVYIGMAADILEFVTEGISIGPVSCSAILMAMILGIWSWSLMQFTIGLTITKRRKTRETGMGRSSGVKCSLCFCCETEVWAILVTVIMQDGPFLAMRIYIITQFQFMSQMMLFFTAKNALVLILQFYRLVVLFCEKEKADVSSKSFLDRRWSESSPEFDPELAVQHLSKSNTVVTSSTDDGCTNTWTHRMRTLRNDYSNLKKRVTKADSSRSVDVWDCKSADEKVDHTRNRLPDNLDDSTAPTKLLGNDVQIGDKQKSSYENIPATYEVLSRDESTYYNIGFMSNEAGLESNPSTIIRIPSTSRNAAHCSNAVDESAHDSFGFTGSNVQIPSTFENNSTNITIPLTSKNNPRSTAVDACNDEMKRDAYSKKQRKLNIFDFSRIKAYSTIALKKINSMTSVVSSAIMKHENTIDSSSSTDDENLRVCETNLNAEDDNIENGGSRPKYQLTVSADASAIGSNERTFKNTMRDSNANLDCETTNLDTSLVWSKLTSSAKNQERMNESADSPKSEDRVGDANFDNAKTETSKLKSMCNIYTNIENGSDHLPLNVEAEANKITSDVSPCINNK